MQRAIPSSDDSHDSLARLGGHLARLLEAFSGESRTRFRDLASTRVVPPGTILVAQGEEPAEIGFVLSGTLAMSKLLPDGRTHILGLLVATDMYGRLFKGAHRHRVEALSEARLLCIRRMVFESLLERETEAERVLLIHALDELDLAREWAVLLTGSKVVTRVASFLVLLARRGKDRLAASGVAPEVRLQLSRADLASYLGTRPETLSRALHELADKGVVSILDPYRFHILDFPALLEVSGLDLALLEDSAS